jgi:hypothetical protein
MNQNTAAHEQEHERRLGARQKKKKKKNDDDYDGNHPNQTPNLTQARRRRSSSWKLGLGVFALGILIPWGFRRGSTYFLLQRPDRLSSIFWFLPPFRPAVHWTDARQVLLIGTMGGGTSQVAVDLQKSPLQLEVCHETANAGRYFCRDGTVSWFHGIRFVPRPSSREDLQAAIERQCSTYTPNMGMHPDLFWDTSNITTTSAASSCTFWHKLFFPSASWDPCGMAEACRDWLQHEWGCALSSSNCVTPFSVVLHQVRHPLRAVESLVAKFCQNRSNRMHPEFVKFQEAWFGRRRQQQEDPVLQEQDHDRSDGDDNTISSCLLTAGWYVVDYHKTMLQAKEAGLIHQSYRIEDTSPCQVAHMAGFWNNPAQQNTNTKDLNSIEEDVIVDEDETTRTTLWLPTRQRVEQACRIMKHQAPMTSTTYKVNRGRVSLTAANFSATNLRNLWDELVVLAETLGYGPITEDQHRPGNNDATHQHRQLLEPDL